ncbi:hypothetical protein [Halogeometricum sp. CBA1124]|uniref:hypothetical protein n=1 Tax=Halogeometricum sp. CBA1124 TaxID=2668071 RepID=UPI00142ABC98|nr:hypothetical protein [Halogeometricum sp. CBA1124]MUV57993.1 hypothetical protein [Halogeometricum sp. CBA1124]
MDPYKRLDRDQMPCHWHVVRSDDGIGFRHRERDVTVEAVEADGPHREFSGRWQLRFRHRVNEAESCRIVGHVTSESEALGALFSWMERINAAVENSDSALNVASLGRQVASDVTPPEQHALDGVRPARRRRPPRPGPERPTTAGRRFARTGAEVTGSHV